MAEKKMKVVFEFNEAEMKKFERLLEEQNIEAKKLDKNIDEIGKNPGFDKATKGVNQLVTGVKAFLALELVKKITGVAIEASKMAASAEAASSAFRNLGGTTADLQKMSQAVNGTADNVRLMNIYIAAMQKGLDKLTLTKVLEFADKQASATGKTLEEVADTIIFSLGKGAVKGLDQVGISSKAVTKDIKAMGATNAILKQMEIQSQKLGDVTDEAADSYDQLATAQKNLQVAFGNLVNSTGFIQMQSFLATSINKLAGFMDDTPAFRAEFAGQTDEQLTARFNKIQSRMRFFTDEEKEQQIETQQNILIELQYRDRESKAHAKKRREEDAIADQAAFKQKLSDEDRLRKIHADRSRLDPKLATGPSDIQGMVDRFNAENEAFRKSRKDEPSRAEILDRGNLEADIESALAPAVQQSKEVEINFASAAASVFSLVDALSSLGDSNSATGKKFISAMQAILGILSFIPGFGVGAQIGSLALGTVSNLAFKNKGGWIPGGGPDQDSVITALTPGEFVTKRTSSQRSPLLLDAINSGELDDKIFKRLTNQTIVNVDQDKVVKAISKMQPVDLFKSGSALYESRRQAGERAAFRKRRLHIG